MRKLTVAVCVALAGCATAPTDVDVFMTNYAMDVAGCRAVGVVRGDHNWFGGQVYASASESAEARIKQDVAALGGNAVLIQHSPSGNTPSNATGIAYRC